MKPIAIIAFAAHVLPAVLAKCCHSGWYHKCDDGTDGTPCCGIQKCNLFCCGCKGGKCRARGTSKLLLERGPADEAFALADSAGNGNLTVNQYLEFMGVEGQPQIWTEWFEKHDRNGDGVVTEDEIQDS